MKIELYDFIEQLRSEISAENIYKVFGAHFKIDPDDQDILDENIENALGYLNDDIFMDRRNGVHLESVELFVVHIGKVICQFSELPSHNLNTDVVYGLYAFDSDILKFFYSANVAYIKYDNYDKAWKFHL